MKLKLLLPILAFIIISCSKKDSDETVISLGNDSLATRLSLKIKDKDALLIDKQLYKDTNGNYLISGSKNKKYWLGYFDPQGNELVTKEYDDPSEMAVGYGAKIKLSYSNIFRVYEVANRIFINRQIRKSEDVVLNDGGFVENLSIISIANRSFDSKYSEIVFGGNVPFTLSVKPWFNGGFIILKMDVPKNLTNGDITALVYNNSGTLMSTHAGADALNQDFYPISDTDFLIIDGNHVTRMTILDLKNSIYHTTLFPELTSDDLLSITSQKIENGILKLVGRITKFSGSSLNVAVNIELSSGKILE